MRTLVAGAAFAWALLTLPATPLRADEIPGKYKPAIAKGLEWLVKQQYKDGHWDAGHGQYPVTMTAMAGMALLSEGSTIREGKYAENIKKAAEWLMSRSMPNGMLGNPNIPGEAGRYMYGHGFALLFLSCVYGEEGDRERRKKLEDILTRAAKFTRDAQTNRGGWGYISARDGNNFDEGSVTITQVQALRAARNAGIIVPAEAIKDSIKYLEQSTGPDGGVRYSLANGGGGAGRPALTAAAISCGFSAGEYNNPLVKKWFQFCQTRIPLIGGARFGHDEYTHYYYAQALYALGDNGYEKMFPGSKEADKLSWKKYRETTFDAMIKSQQSDGSWTGGQVGLVFITSVYLTIMQMDNGAIPLYQR